MRAHEDAFGRALWDYYRGETERVRQLGWEAACSRYFTPYEEWCEREQKAIRLATGRVLDIGCAAGRHALYLQEHGHDVLAVDNSPLSVKVARLRGVKKARVMSITQLSYKLGVFDTVLMLGNNFGLVATPERGQWLLRRFKRMTSDDACILAGYGGDKPLKAEDVKDYPHLREQVQANTRRGKMPGAVVVRKRYGRYVARVPWLYCSTREVKAVVKGTGWAMHDRIYDETGACVAVLRKER